MSRPEPLRTRALMRPYALIYLYRRRLRAHAAQELFAGTGIAIAVALVFATTVAQSSIAGSTGEVVHAVTGSATLQLRARDNAGFDESLLARVQSLPGVKQAAPLLEQTATVIGPHGHHTTVDLAGADISLAILDGLAHTLPAATLSGGGISLSRATAKDLTTGLKSTAGGPGTVIVKLRGAEHRLKVSAVLGHEAVGALSRSLVAVMPLAQLQRLADLHDQITRVLVQADHRRGRQVRRELVALAGGRLAVAPANQDVTLLDQALRPSGLASGLFATIGALLGFLLAFNAMLLTVPERRQAIADLRISGTRRTAIVEMVLFQALCLGVAASIVGLAGGYALSVGVFHQSSAYLAEAFTLGSNTVVGTRPLLLALIGGVLATCLASVVPLADLRRGRARDAVYRQDGVPGNALSKSSRRWLFAGAVTLIALASILYAADHAATIVAAALLALATILAVPLVFAAVLAVAGLVSELDRRLTILPLALASLRGTTLRSLALAATGAVALFGSVALGGSRENLLRGIGSFAHNYVAAADIWVTNPGDNQAVDEFPADGHTSAIAGLPAVAGVRSFQGSFLALGDRRVWVIARPPGADRRLIASQIVHGNPSTAIARLKAGGWIAISQQIAAEHHVGVGGRLTLPTPSGPTTFAIAATTTNLAWSPGVIFISDRGYARAWGSSAPTALGIDLRPGANVAAARGAVAHLLGPASGLEVSTAATRQASIDALTSEGLGQLGEISTLLLIAAIAAMAAALGASVWQRRTWLAGLRLAGARPQRLRRILLIEATLMLGAGCLTGAVAGIYGQVMLDGYLKDVTGFPLASIVTGGRPLEIFVLVLAVALAIMAIPGWIASRVSPALALEDE